MRHGDLMKDPAYSRIIFLIEQKVTQNDESAKGCGITLIDSQVISVLTKALGAAKGKRTKWPETSNPRDLLLGTLLQDLKEARSALVASCDDDERLRRDAEAKWAACLGCVIESAKLRKGSTPGSRNYLDFLPGFMAAAGGDAR